MAAWHCSSFVTSGCSSARLARSSRHAVALVSSSCCLLWMLLVSLSISCSLAYYMTGHAAWSITCIGRAGDLRLSHVSEV